MRQRFSRFLSYVTIIVLLPYIVTVFLSGPASVSSSNVDETQVRVCTDAGEVSMSLSEYAIGVLAKEIPASCEKEALKAQAILVRTDVYSKLESGGKDAILEESFWDQKQMQEAWGAGKYHANLARLEEAWEETEGQVVTYDGKLAKTPFFRLSNGSTRDGKEVLGSDEYPYLKIVSCPLDIEAKEQMKTITVDDMDAEVAACDTAGYVLQVKVGEETVSGEEFRSNYHLESSCFSLQHYNGKLRITTRGIGHGLGMSQYTANELEKEGKNVEDILQYFFEGTQIKEVAEIVKTDP